MTAKRMTKEVWTAPVTVLAAGQTMVVHLAVAPPGRQGHLVLVQAHRDHLALALAHPDHLVLAQVLAHPDHLVLVLPARARRVEVVRVAERNELLRWQGDQRRLKRRFFNRWASPAFAERTARPRQN